MSDLIGIGECPEHGFVTENDGATIEFPTIAVCHCDRDLDRATFADAEEVRSRV